MLTVYYLGNVVPNLFDISDERFPIASAVDAAEQFLHLASKEQREKVMHPLDSSNWRAWSNPEMYVNQFGLRLEELDEKLILAIFGILKASLSPEGFEKALAAMRINHFLGELLGAPGVLNKYSYNFLLFGQPSESTAWGWSLYGHHLCLNVFIQGTQVVLTPTFTGAEPNCIDSGPYKGTRILYPEEELGLRLMQSLRPELQKQVQVYEKMHDEKMPSGRWNRHDQRHMCGAFQDNRIVPYEGAKIFDGPAELSLLLEIVEQFVLYLPASPRQKRLDDVARHAAETYFCWIGGYGDQDPFYYRIQSPVIICEFDHHSGVFLVNTEPAKFHTHTIVRTPNGGDYGHAIRK